jgi:hypothetical protein
MPSTTCATRDAMKKPGPTPRSVRKIALSTIIPTIRERKMTKVFNTP